MGRQRPTPPAAAEPQPAAARPPATNRAFAAALEMLNLKQNQAAERLCISRSSVSDYATGNEPLSLDNYHRKLAGLGLHRALAERLLADVAAVDETAQPRQASALEPEVSAEIGLLATQLAASLPEKVREAFAERDRRRVQKLWQKLEALPLAAWRLVVAAAPELQGWALVKLVGEESARAASTDAKLALELACFALWVAERVSGEEDWASQVHAWAYLGNARRVANKLAAAEEAFTRSKHLKTERPKGRPELPEPWRLLDLEASLRIELRQGPEALRLLDQATRLAPQTGPVQAHLLCIRARALYRMDDLEGSIATLRQGLAQIGRETAPRLYFQLQSNLVERLTETGQAAEAAERFPELRRLQGHVGNGLNDLRLQWLEGKIDAGLGRLDRAIEILTQVRAAFAREDLRYDEAQAGVELAGLYLQKGRTADTKRLVLAMAPVFHAQGVPEEAAKALALFRRAVEKEAATPAFAKRVATFLRRAQHDPELRFEEAA